MAIAEEQTKEQSLLKRALPLIVIACGVLGFSLLVFLKQKPPKAPPQEAATPVLTVMVTPSTEYSVLQGYGTVQASQQVELKPEVSGTIISINPQFIPGETIEEKTSLAQIDPRDYEVQVRIQEAEVARAEAALLKEQGMQIVAKREWNMVKGKLSANDLQMNLALRKPQLKEAEASLEAAKSNLARATLAIERSRLSVPFNALIIDKHVNVGDYVNPQTPIATLASSDEYWIYVHVPHEQLQFLTEDTKSKAEVRVSAGNGPVHTYQGYVKNKLGDLGSEGRMARVLVAIPNPLSQVKGHPLLLGSYAEVIIEGKKFEQVYAIPNEAIRAKQQLWIYSDKDTLHLTDTTPLFYRDAVTYIQGSNADPLEIITTELSHPLEGLPLIRVEDLKKKKKHVSQTSKTGK